ncbi:RGCVC family protein [Hoyosella rhizosphaerae]|nr:RGCVC family protein [Hoyosella rhizosphaerae]
MNLTGYAPSTAIDSHSHARAADTHVGECEMCGHPSSDHDEISRRYCLATSRGNLARGCICPQG